MVSLVRRRGGGGSVGIATGLHGAGGFGKTTLAQVVCAHRKVRRRFPGGVHVITIGRDVRGRVAIAAKVAEVTRYVTGDTMEAGTDPDQAGARLGALLDQRPRTLLVLDDVWEAEQLTPFLQGGDRNCVRLITTRNPAVLPAGADRIVVDRMSQKQAEAVLTHGLPELPTSLVQDLVLVTGRWALLLRMANQRLAAQAATGADLTQAVQHLLERLQRRGPSGIDVLQGPVVALDLDDPKRRNQAVRASIEAATTLLPPEGGRRFAELGIFAEDETIPVSLVCQLWQATTGLHEMESRALCKQMADLSLLSLDAQTAGGAISLHDVVRDYLRSELGPELSAINACFVGGIARDIPWAAPPLSRTGQVRAWWGVSDGYLLDHLIEHMIDGGLVAQAEEVASDLRWIRTRLHQRGPTAPWNDLSLLPTPSARLMAQELGRAAPLLSPTEPAHFLDGILYSRLGNVSAWRAQTALLLSGTSLVDRNTPPDLPDPCFVLDLTEDTGVLTAVAIAPDGTLLATGNLQGRIHVWEVGTGRLLRSVTIPSERVYALAIGADGFSLAATCTRTVRLWDLRNGQQLQQWNDWGLRQGAALAVADGDAWLAHDSDAGRVHVRNLRTGTNRGVQETQQTSAGFVLSMSPDARWLAILKDRHTIHIWDTRQRAQGGRNPLVLGRYRGGASALAISGSGQQVVTAHSDHTIRIWDTTRDASPRTLTGRINPAQGISTSADGRWVAATGETGQSALVWDLAPPPSSISRGNQVRAVAISPDGTWFVTANADYTLRTWDAATGALQRVIACPTDSIRSVTITPDGDRILSVGYGGNLRLWDARSGTCLTHFPVRSAHWTGAVAIAPNADWVATDSSNGDIGIWDLTSGTRRHTLAGRSRNMHALAASPDGATLVSAADHGDVRLWNPVTGELLRSVSGHSASAKAVDISRDGRWVASAGGDQNIRVWDTTSGEGVRYLWGHTAPVKAVSISPDGRWVASTGGDQNIRVWDTTSGEAAALMRTSAALDACVFSPCSTSLYVASSSGLFTYNIRDVGEP
ncbi:NB-ARC domain-containing protein [Streptomyces sp. NBC_00853]|uniref:NB-ARC domain-containing protein n=1 Tax=Streptomyces sp. NBC_00853 TaxID=2903681 RepID=UPI003873794F|nr:NB-ARC domain-containing protein [Streptomyces sp. NBC_00853]